MTTNPNPAVEPVTRRCLVAMVWNGNVTRCDLESGHPGEHEQAGTGVTWISCGDQHLTDAQGMVVCHLYPGHAGMHRGHSDTGRNWAWCLGPEGAANTPEGNATARLELAREALVATGYFTADQVGPDIAPRITEYAAAMSRKVDRLRRQRDKARKQRDRWMHPAGPDLRAQRDEARDRLVRARTALHAGDLDQVAALLGLFGYGRQLALARAEPLRAREAAAFLEATNDLAARLAQARTERDEALAELAKLREVIASLRQAEVDHDCDGGGCSLHAAVAIAIGPCTCDRVCEGDVETCPRLHAEEDL